MKRILAPLPMLLGVMWVGPAISDCGPFNMFKDNDYCVSCSNGRRWKQNQCPGGEVGVVALGVLYPGCQISYYSPNTCSVTTGLDLKLINKLTEEGHLLKDIIKDNIQENK